MPGHVVVLSERHLRHLLLSYMKYYNGPARIYPWRKMRRSRAPSIAPGIFFVAQSWADCITNMPGFNFTTGTAGIVIPTQAKRRKRGSPMAQSQGEAKVDEALLSLLPGT